MPMWNTSFLAGRIVGPLALLAGGVALVRPEILPAYLPAHLGAYLAGDTALALGKALVLTALVVMAGAGLAGLPQGIRSKFLPFGRRPAQRVVIRIRNRR